jgi:hypothetical protein
MTTHLGFRVTGRTPTKPYNMTSDTFELRASAIECAWLLARGGWTHLDVVEILSGDDGEKSTPIDWDRTKDARVRLSRFAVTVKNVEAVLAFLAQNEAEAA